MRLTAMADAWGAVGLTCPYCARSWTTRSPKTRCPECGAQAYLPAGLRRDLATGRTPTTEPRFYPPAEHASSAPWAQRRKGADAQRPMHPRAQPIVAEPDDLDDDGPADLDDGQDDAEAEDDDQDVNAAPMVTGRPVVVQLAETLARMRVPGPMPIRPAPMPLRMAPAPRVTRPVSYGTPGPQALDHRVASPADYREPEAQRFVAQLACGHRVTLSGNPRSWMGASAPCPRGCGHRPIVRLSR